MGILNPLRAHTLILVMVLTEISTSAVKVTPTREWTTSIYCVHQETYTENVVYARYRKIDKRPLLSERLGLYLDNVK